MKIIYFERIAGLEFMPLTPSRFKSPLELFLDRVHEAVPHCSLNEKLARLSV